MNTRFTIRTLKQYYLACKIKQEEEEEAEVVRLSQVHMGHVISLSGEE